MKVKKKQIVSKYNTVLTKVPTIEEIDISWIIIGIEYTGKASSCYVHRIRAVHKLFSSYKNIAILKLF